MNARGDRQGALQGLREPGTPGYGSQGIGQAVQVGRGAEQAGDLSRGGRRRAAGYHTDLPQAGRGGLAQLGVPGRQPLRGQLRRRTVRTLRAELRQGYLGGQIVKLACRDWFREHEPGKGSGPGGHQPVLERRPGIPAGLSRVAPADEQGVGDTGQLHPAGHPGQQIRSLAGRERLRPGAGREGQHHLAAVGGARRGRPGQPATVGPATPATVGPATPARAGPAASTRTGPPGCSRSQPNATGAP